MTFKYNLDICNANLLGVPELHWWVLVPMVSIKYFQIIGASIKNVFRRPCISCTYTYVQWFFSVIHYGVISSKYRSIFILFYSATGFNMAIKVFLVKIGKSFYLYKCAVKFKSVCWGFKMLKGIIFFRQNLEIPAIVNCHKWEKC